MCLILNFNNLSLQKMLRLLLLLFFTQSLMSQIIPGAYLTEQYIGIIKQKNIALVVNPTSVINKTHLVDSLFKLGIKIKVIFAPEHGFRGNISAGTTVNDTTDKTTGIKVISLYGNHKKPNRQDLEQIDYVVFDIQDVGVRFYTYISTMHYVMEACAEFKIPLMVLDRPNPNGHYFDGPILEKKHQSFVGMHPIPIVHGCTVGELAKMINGEKWLNNQEQCELKIINCKNYKHQSSYVLAIKPSPNLQTQSSIYLYPSLGLFEGTTISIGHGTTKPYQSFGSIDFKWGNLDFKPISIKGVSENPKFLGQDFKGFDLTEYGFEQAYKDSKINLNWLIYAYQNCSNKNEFFNSFFEKLSGTETLRNQIISGKSASEIRLTWQKGLENYKKTREKYLLYP